MDHDSSKVAKSSDSIILEYFKLTQKYQRLYGNSTLVFLQVGAFFEVYSIRHPILGTYEITPIQIFSEQCDLNIAEKKITLGNCPHATTVHPFPILSDDPAHDTITKKAILQWIDQLPPCQVVMAGVRDHQLERYVQKMIDIGFTVVVYAQETVGKVHTRKLHDIYSPGTYLSHEPSSKQGISNHITCVWFSKVAANSALRRAVAPDSVTRDLLLCGIASMNIYTGESYLFEYQTPLFVNPTTLDELNRHLSAMVPNEIVLVSELSQDQWEGVLRYLTLPEGISRHCVMVNEETVAARNCMKQTYIHAQLGSLFSEDTFLVCSEFQTHIVATQAFCYLMHFIEKHNRDLTRKLQFPVFTNTSHRLILANHTLKQLNIIPDGTHGVRRGRTDSVLSFLNQCQTPMGKRRFEHQLVHPTFDEAWLNGEYEAIAQVLSGTHIISDLQRPLREIRDIERIARQMVTKRILPSTIVQLHQTLTIWKDIYTSTILNHAFYHAYVTKNHDQVWKELLQLLDFLETTFVLEACANCHSTKEFDHPILNASSFSELAACIARHDNAQSELNIIQKTLNDIIIQGTKTSKEDEYVRVHKTDKSGVSLQITKKRGALLKERLQQQRNGFMDIQIVKASASYDEITSPRLKQISHDLLHMEDELNAIMASTYASVIANITEKWYDVLETLAKQIAIWDVLINKAHLAREYRYCRPHIMPFNELNDPDVVTDDICGTHVATPAIVQIPASRVDARGLRHALIEQIQTNEIYVTNDVMVGSESTHGILLYGTNAVGKTSLIRALGVAVIMAQSGCYVPCTTFHYRPYHTIFSRILGNDNLFKGLSTFAVEMSELRLILKMSDTNSLVLGDELCSGTEIESALSLFMAGLMHLYQRGASFLFATHFHEILKFQELHDLTGVAVKHMSVIYDPVGDCLIYDRLLKDGPGNGTYGIEVAKSMHMDAGFLEQAYQIRHRYFVATTQDVLEQSASHYNSKKLCGTCEICHQNMGEEIHHLQYQKRADETGFIGHFHKNHPANLISICKSCHDAWHSEQDAQMVRKKTTKGYRLST